MAKAELILLAILHAVLVIHGTPLDEKYRFRQMLDSDGMYWLHWSFDIEENTISFAVNVSTTGWVGFGLSPNGQMPGSDVVIGWVDDRGTTYFHVSTIIYKKEGGVNHYCSSQHRNGGGGKFKIPKKKKLDILGIEHKMLETPLPPFLCHYYIQTGAMYYEKKTLYLFLVTYMLPYILVKAERDFNLFFF